MNNYLKKNIANIFLIFLYLQPIIDLLTSLSINTFHLSISFGMIIRFLFLVLMLYYAFIINKSITKPKLIYLISILIYLIIFAILTIVFKDTNTLTYELTNVFKFLYFPILLTIIDYHKLKITALDLVKIALIYLVLIFIPSIFNLNYNSYTEGKIGSVGWFNSGNEISAILAILTPFIINYLFNNHVWYKKLLISILTLYCYFIIGSKIIIIALIVSSIYELIHYFKAHKLTNKPFISISLSIIIIALIGLYLVPKTNFYYNLKLHLTYLNINSINDLFTFNSLNRFIFSDRLTFLANTYLIFVKANLFHKLFGLGFIMNYATDLVSLKVIEMDFFDIFFHLGIIGLIIVLIPLIKKIKTIKPNALVKFSLILGLVIAFLVGHTIGSPGVAIYLVYLFKGDIK
jgi:hypothetical protein